MAEPKERTYSADEIDAHSGAVPSLSQTPSPCPKRIPLEIDNKDNLDRAKVTVFLARSLPAPAHFRWRKPS